MCTSAAQERRKQGSAVRRSVVSWGGGDGLWFASATRPPVAEDAGGSEGAAPSSSLRQGKRAPGRHKPNAGARQGGGALAAVWWPAPRRAHRRGSLLPLLLYLLPALGFDGGGLRAAARLIRPSRAQGDLGRRCTRKRARHRPPRVRPWASSPPAAS
jgi:hypothetical protein